MLSKKIQILTLIFLSFFFFGEQPVLAGKDKKNSPALLLLEEKKTLSTQKKIIKNNESMGSHTKSSAKKPQISKKISRQPLSKEAVLSKDYYKPQKNRKQLTREFNRHLVDLKNVCSLLNHREVKLKKERENFKLFLKTSLKDPYMTYALKLKFRDVLSLIEAGNSDSLMSLEVFTVSYRRLYNLPENIEKQNYPHIWAKIIYETLECALSQAAV